MSPQPYRDMELLNTFVKSAQYIVGLSSRQDLWDHVERLVVTYFQADWAAFVRQDATGGLSVDHALLPGSVVSKQILTGQVQTLVHDVLESGFLACQVIPTPAPSMAVFLPIAGEHQAGKALLIGHHTVESPPRERLNVYLALASLAGTMLERLHVERELNLHRENLEELVKTRTGELAEAKRQNELILDSIGEGIFGVDVVGRIVFVNPSARQMTGWDSAELIGRYAHDTFHHTRCDGSVCPMEECLLHDTLRTGQAHHVADAQFFRKDGSCFPVEFKTTPITEDGHIVGAVLVFRDITDRRRAQLERETTIEFLHLVHASIGTPQLIQAAATFFQEQSGCQAVGIRLREGDDYPYYEARGFSREFVLAENSLCTRGCDGAVIRDEVGNPVIACMCGNVICGRFDPSKPFFTPAGSFWTNCTSELLASTTEADRQAHTRNQCHGQGYESVALICLHVGEARLGLLQLNDRRKGMFSPETIALWERLAGHLAVALAKSRAEESLREREQQLRLFVEHAPAAIAMLDTQMRYVAVSNRWMADYGLTGRLVLGRSHYEMFPEIPDRWKEVHRRCLGGAIERAEEDLFQRPDGSVQWIRWEIRPWQAAGGAIGGIIIFSEDITARKRAEQQLKELNETLEKRVAERTAVAEVRAEQLRMLAQELTQAEQRERQRIAHILHEHFQQLLVGAKFNLGMVQAQDAVSRESLRRTDQVLSEAVEASRSLAVELNPPILHYGGLGPALSWLGQWMLEKHGLTVEVVADPHAPMPPEDVQVLLFQAARELLFNVVKHARIGRAKVELKQEAAELLRLSVSDGGAGFDTNRPADKARTSGGFGLFSIRERLSFLEARVEIRSKLGTGTCISLLVPVPPLGEAATAAGMTAEAPAAAWADKEDAAAGEPTAPGARIKVLIADDHAIVRDGMSRLLQTLPDIEIVGQAKDGREAVELALQLRPDVVVMDVSMPEMNGIEATRCILAELPAARIIGLSMHADQDVADQMRQVGAVAYLAKSGRTDGLIAAIQASVRKT